MSDLISRQAAIKAIEKLNIPEDMCVFEILSHIMLVIATLPSAQPEQTKMIKEIRKWLNSGNRGKADYFIVDKIEEIINKYER